MLSVDLEHCKCCHFIQCVDTIFLLFLRYLVLFNPIEQERLCVVTVLVNSARVRVLTEDGQTLPVQLSAQWVSAVEMSGEVYQVCVSVSIHSWILNKVSLKTYTLSCLFVQASFMARLPALGLAVFHLYDSADSPMTLRSDTLLRIPGRGQSIRGLDPLPVRSQTVDAQPFYIQSQSLTLGFSGTTGLLEVRWFCVAVVLGSEVRN